MAKKAKSTSPAAKSTKDICFVIMPFGGWLDDYYVSIYSLAIDSAGLEAHRADDLFRPSTIVNDIWSYTKKAKVLLADLSGKNPNVFYELGLAHALAKPVILIAESMEEIPFDLRALRIIIYDKNAPDWGRLLREKIEASIKEVLLSPAEAVLPAFLNVKGSGSTPTVSPEQKEIIEIKQELDLLRREIRSRAEEPRIERSRNGVGPQEVRALMDSYITRGMPDEIIVRRLSDVGAPKGWIIDELENRKTIMRKQTLRQAHAVIKNSKMKTSQKASTDG
jgi:hypothetical protein